MKRTKLYYHNLSNDMEITTVISVFERLTPIYEKAYKNTYLPKDLNSGLCWASYSRLDVSIRRIMDKDYGYYRNLMISDSGNDFTYLFPRPKKTKDLKSRIDFMKTEIKDLKRLIKKGYTHI